MPGERRDRAVAAPALRGRQAPPPPLALNYAALPPAAQAAA
jgi:hypothetical protein